METKTKRDELNKIYRPLYTKAANILSCLKNRALKRKQAGTADITAKTKTANIGRITFLYR